jgi:hypothetical protein
MNSSTNREGISVFARVAVFVVGLALAVTLVVGGAYARDDLPKPYIQPGDGDGPAGISESVSQKVGEDNLIPTLQSVSDARARDADVFVFTLKRFLHLQIILSLKKGS